MKFLYPLSVRIAKYLKIETGNSNNIKKISIGIGTFLAVCMMSILSEVMKEENNIQNLSIKRPEYYEDHENIELNVYKDGEKDPYTINMDISPRQYTKEEIFRNFEDAYNLILEAILNENETLSHVTSDLKLITGITVYNITVEWYSDNYQLLDSEGILNNENIKEPVPTVLTAILKYGEYSCEYEIHVIIYPEELDEEEQFIKQAQEALMQSDKKSPKDQQVQLPGTIEGVQVRYELPEENNIIYMIPLGLIIGVMLILQVDEKAKKEKKNIKKQLKYDYAEMISKITLLTGAGMNISRAWEKIALDYKRKRDEEACRQRVVYEEMLTAYYQIKTGIPEVKIYEEFGKRCDCKEYLKLGVLLAENITKGTKGIAELLETEVLNAFEERKNIAKQMGEEASAKILLPMGILLAVVMLIVVVPAFMTFGI